MPEISLFYGLEVTMYYDDHNPLISMQNTMEIKQ